MMRMEFTLETKGLSKHFGGLYAVDGVNLGIEKGKITSLIGPNGAGKTTAFNLISGVLEPDVGRIIFNGNDITGLEAHERAALGIARTFQLTKVFRHLTIRENLLLAAHKNDQHILASLLSREEEKKGAFDEVMELVGLQKDLNENAASLSYGQRKLLELARAVIMPHSLLMLDEPVAGVNPKTRGQVKEILAELRSKGETTLLIEHDMNFVMGISDHVIVMNRGKIICEGKPGKVKKDRKVLEAYLG